MKLWLRFLLIVIILCFSMNVYSSEKIDFDFSTLFEGVEITGISGMVGLYTNHFSGKDFKDDDTKYDFEKYKDYNETNNFYAVRVETNTEFAFFFSRFNNSYYSESYSIGTEWEFWDNILDTKKWYAQFNVGSDFMMTTGYEDDIEVFGTGARVIFAPAPYIKYQPHPNFAIKNSFIYGSVHAITAEATKYF